MPADPTPPAIAVHRLRKYNPARMTDAEIELTFVARKDVLERILQDLAGERADSRPQHHLIIGQRGMGKTTLLLRLAAALRSAAYRERFVPLVFAEEQYSVDRLSKFWLNCLDSLADCCELEGDAAAADRIDGVVQRLDRSTSTTAAGDADAARATLRALLDQAAQLQRRPVLLVDNLQIVFERTSDQQHELRDALTQPGAPIIVAASPQLPSDLQDYGAAFYDQFKTHYLRALTVDDMRHILVSLAEMTHRDDVSRHVLGHPGRL
ncbi:MAG: AAA family ATPase, partial [Planctomycetaceae bacterium]|nr:AAA family ATPase [Planctomycetaceae bacterium]